MKLNVNENQNSGKTDAPNAIQQILLEKENKSKMGQSVYDYMDRKMSWYELKNEMSRKPSISLKISLTISQNAFPAPRIDVETVSCTVGRFKKNL